MILKKLQIENLRSYERQEIVFPKGSTLLSGDIGSGKTSILLAVEFALFGLQPSQKASSLLRSNADSGKVSRLLNLLGFDKRKELSRINIERALSKNEYSIVKDELSLDPNSFKLVCIPSDIYLRLGESLGWGKKELWTHFDGYEVLPNKRFSALAGGDCRFGGLLDLVTIGREYESDHVIARFAVIQRKGMIKMLH